MTDVNKFLSMFEAHRRYAAAADSVTQEHPARLEGGDVASNLGADKILANYDRLIALQAPGGGTYTVGAEALAARSWFYGDASAFRAGMFQRLPDITGKRKLEGGTRLTGGRRAPASGPLVSVVTAVWNNPDTLQRCIDSVRAQTWGNVEHIIIDGGSDEPTLEVIRANADHLSYYVSEPDTGIYSAMNKGIAAAQGDYVCLLNSDDRHEPEFIEKVVNVARRGHAPFNGIVYTDFFNEETHLKAQEINNGILFGNLNITHCSFLVPRDIYNRVGPYNERYRVVSDVMWIRRAFLCGEEFSLLPEPLFRFSDGGLSSGASEAHRRLIIDEAARSYQELFPVLTHAEAEEIYLFRFRKDRAGVMCRLAERHAGDKSLTEALRGYVEYCMRDRANFRLQQHEIGKFFPNYVRLADALGVDRRCFQVETKDGLLSDVLARFDEALARRKPSSAKTILHFVSVFSAPSETFIYDLLLRMEAEGDWDNFVLFERPELRDRRPYDKAFRVAWQHFPEIVAKQIYKYLVQKLQPDLVIGHFALNEWKWAERTKDLGIQVPTISMCHGIDAFALRTKDDYRTHIVDGFSRRSDTSFTAVSNYLREELLSNGVPPEKVHLVHNVVNDRFFQHRKTRDFYDYKRPLRLVAVGRLIALKGHNFLLDALSRFQTEATPEFHLTIVYGNGADELQNLSKQAEALGLSEKITFEPFVDFNQTPDYLAQFDLFIHPSTYSTDAFGRSETFGVSVLEAIAAGLPVISSDAGGLPEVIGEEARFARIVPHANSDALADALLEMWRDGAAFADNMAFATDRRDRFSSRAQIEELRKLMDKVMVRPVRAALFSSSTVQGAGYAAFRLHRGLRDTSVTSHMFTTVRHHDSETDLTVINHPSGNNNNWRRLQEAPKPGLTIFTVNDDFISNATLLKLVADFDVINVHWHARFLSLDNIAALTHSGKPVVMTIRDMMPITGGCHFFHGCEEWKDACKTCPQMPEGMRSYPATVLAMKRANFNFDNLTVVCISNHTRGIIAQAPYFKDCRIEVIPNSIETDTFRPYDRMEMRKQFGLPLDKKIIGYVPSFSSEVKGYREIVAALEMLDTEALGGEPFVLMVGNETPATMDITLPKTALGYIDNNELLAQAYSCADVVVVPSLEETFSNTAAEAISCGVPVVGFKTGAIPDLAIDGRTGYTFEVGDVAGLAKGIEAVLNGPDMGPACREHAHDWLAFMKQAHAYEALFSSLT